MAVNPKEKKMLQGILDNAESASSSELPDGTFQFKVLKKTKNGKATGYQMGNNDKPTFKTALKVVGGDEEYLGTEVYINDNLETSENMGWFIRKLSRLNIQKPEDASEITDGDIADAMIDKVFEGQVKTKNDFMNVYVNRLIGEGDDEEADEEKGEEAEGSEIEEGTRVSYKGTEAEVLEVLDDGKLRVKTDDGDKFRWDKDKVKVVEAEAEEDDEEEEEEEEEKEEKSKSKKQEDEEDEDEEEDEDDEEKDDDEFVVPEPDDVVDMPASKVKAALNELDIEAEKVKNPRAVLKAFCTLAHDSKAKLEMSEISPLAAALDVEFEKGEPIKDTLKALAKAVSKKLG